MADPRDPAADGVHGCLHCGAPFGEWLPTKRSRHNAKLCQACGKGWRRERAAEAKRARERESHRRAAELDLFARIRFDDLPAAIEDTEAELRRAAGEGPGPDDEPRLSYPNWDRDGAERVARVRIYAAAVARGGRIRFVPRSRVLAREVESR